jgi:hypothetical protein
MHFELSYSTFSINLDLFKKDIFMLKKIGIILTVSTLISNAAFADDTGKWSVKLYGGISTMGDQSIDQTGVPGVTPVIMVLWLEAQWVTITPTIFQLNLHGIIDQMIQKLISPMELVLMMEILHQIFSL